MMLCVKLKIYAFCWLLACFMFSSLKANEVDTNTVIQLNAKALELAYSQPDSALLIAKKSLEAARQLNYTYGEVRALIRMGIVYDVQSKDSLATEMYLASLGIAEKCADSSGIASNYNNLGLIYWKQNLLSNALEYFSKAYTMFRNLKQYVNLANTSNNIGLIYSEMDRWETALVWYKRALKDYEKINEKPSTPFEYEVYSNIGNVYEDMQKIDSAIFYNSRAIQGFRSYNNLYSLAKALNNSANLLCEKKMDEKAIPLFAESMELSLKIENLYSYVSSGFNLSRCYMNLEKYNKEMEILKKIYPFIDKLKNNELGYKICFHLSRGEFRKNNFNEGIKYYNEYKDYHDAYYREILDKNITNSEKKFEVQENKRKLFVAQNEKLKAELELNKRNDWLLILSLIVVIVVFVSVVVIQRNKARQERAKTKAVLEERDKGLKAIIEAQEEERVRIAKELHEGVGNQLLALQMNLRQGIAKQQDDEDTERINTMLAEAMDEVRNVSHQMMPKVLQEFGCVPALSDMLGKTLIRLGIICNFETHNVSGKRFDSRLEITIFRVAQELVNNIIKHSQADTVNIQFMELRHTLVLLVEDNGKGINASAISDGIGMASIKSRVGAVSGELNIVSEKNKGTTTTIRIPLN